MIGSDITWADIKFVKNPLQCKLQIFSLKIVRAFSAVVIDHQLEHLKLNDIVKTTIRGGDTSKDFNVKTAIKSEPGLSATTVNNLLLDDGDEEVNY